MRWCGLEQDVDGLTNQPPGRPHDEEGDDDGSQRVGSEPSRGAHDDRRYAGTGTGAWDDWNEPAQTTRATLEETTGINVPERYFVLRMLAIYGLILVPLNWLLFKVVGRLELAWAAVPVITIVFTGVVVWRAELNIGFARFD